MDQAKGHRSIKGISGAMTRIVEEVAGWRVAMYRGSIRNGSLRIVSRRKRIISVANWPNLMILGIAN